MMSVEYLNGFRKFKNEKNSIKEEKICTSVYNVI